MSRRKTVSKKEVLAAMRYGPLNSGNWITYNINGECQVCAVGAVLRRVHFSDNAIENFGSSLADKGRVTPYLMGDGIHEAIIEFLNKKQYLRALSIKFENQVDKTGTGKKTREVMTNFVKKNFPKRIKLDPSA